MPGEIYASDTWSAVCLLSSLNTQALWRWNTLVTVFVRLGFRCCFWQSSDRVSKSAVRGVFKICECGGLCCTANVVNESVSVHGRQPVPDMTYNVFSGTLNPAQSNLWQANHLYTDYRVLRLRPSPTEGYFSSSSMNWLSLVCIWKWWLLSRRSTGWTTQEGRHSVSLARRSVCHSVSYTAVRSRNNTVPRKMAQTTWIRTRMCLLE